MRRFKTQAEIDEEKRVARAIRTTYPTHKKLLIYGRQSNKKQVMNNKESVRQQNVELWELGLLYGWQKCDMTLYTENKYNKYGELTDEIRSASGARSIDERPGLKIVMGRIAQGDVGAIMVWAVDRLFRDEDMIEPAVFAKQCKEHHVIVLTPSDEFDFNNPRRDDRKRFLDAAQAAADYNTKHVKGRMLPAKNDKAMRGEYVGHNIPVGFMLDDAHEHYVPNPEWAPTIKRLFKRFHALDANTPMLYREIVGKPIFPELSEDIKARIGHIRVTPVQGGYTIKSPKGLKYILTNVAYIGYVAFDGQIVKRNAHTAIVDANDFWFAYNALADTDTDGTPIERPEKVVRYQQQSDVERREALLEGTHANGRAVITSTGKSVYVAQQSSSKNGAYRIEDLTTVKRSEYTAAINIPDLDAIVEQAVLLRMRPLAVGLGMPLIESKLYEKFKAVEQAIDTPMSTVNETVAETKSKIARLDRKYDVEFDLMTDKELRDNREQKIRLVRKLNDLEHKQERDKASQEDMREVAAIIARGNTYEQWKAMKFAKKQKFLRLTTESIVLDEIADGWFTLTILWSRYLNFYESDVAYIWQQGKRGNMWTNEEKQFLREHYATANHAWLLEHLPARTWQSIVAQASRINITRHMQWNDTTLPHFMSLNDKRVMDEHGLVLNQPDKCVWWRSILDTNRDKRTLSRHLRLS